MAQIEELNIWVKCPHCGHTEWQDVAVAIANTGADDGGISVDEEGVSDCDCSHCGEEFQVVLQCFATVRKDEFS